MIERFNFYDVYGYLIPGLALLFLFWLPYGIINHRLPDDKLSSAVVAIAAGYVLGHFIVAIAGELISGRTARDKGGKRNYPSVVLLNKSSKALYEDTKSAIQKNAEYWFRLNVNVEQDADEKLTGVRQTAFFRCRPIVNKITSYPEQFQGLYAMMSGLAVAFGIGFFYIVGWATAASLVDDVSQSARVILVIGLTAMFGLGLTRVFQEFDKKGQSRPWDGAMLAAVALFLLGAGYLLAIGAHPSRNLAGPVWVIAVLCLVAALRCYDSYRYFATEFAKAVWTYLPAQDDPLAKGIIGK